MSSCSKETVGSEIRTQAVGDFPRNKMRVEILSAMEILDRAVEQLGQEPPPVSAENKPYASACEAGFSRAIKTLASRDIRAAQDRLNWLSKNLAEEAEGQDDVG